MSEAAGPSNDPSASSSSAAREEAGPLPLKIGELGYLPPAHPPAAALAPNSQSFGHSRSQDDLSLSLHPHPAERNITITRNGRSLSNTSLPLASSAASSTSSASKTRSLFKLFRIGSSSSPSTNESDKHRRIFGVSIKTAILLSLRIIITLGIVAAWAVTVTLVSRSSNKSSTKSSLPTPSSSSDQSASDSGSDSTSSDFNINENVILIHSGFAIAVLVMLIFIERSVFLARAERYAFLHPGETLRGAGRTDASVPFAPWLRGPLPTYAHAVGFRGTGDVEDAAIAAPPPPQYGNTRGSTLLLSNLIRSVSRSSTRSSRNSNSDVEDPRGRPVSYKSEVSVQVQMSESSPNLGRSVSRMSGRSFMGVAEDARRARDLEATLGALERGGRATPNV